MRRHDPDPRQGLFRWVWSDPDDDRPDAPEDDDPEPDLPPLRDRLRERHGPRTETLRGVPIVLAKAPVRPAGRSATPGPEG
jgi:hypothetical protein